MSKIIGIIPARGGSKRFPNKNIVNLLGKPLIVYSIEAAFDARCLDRVIVSTDDNDIAAVANRCGAEVITRPTKLSTDTSTIDDAVRHVVDKVGDVETAVLLQANVPVRAKGVIDKVVSKLYETCADTVATAYKVSQHPEWMKCVTKNGEVLPYTPGAVKYRHQDMHNLYLLDGSVIVTKASVLEKTKGNKKVHAYMGSDVRIVEQDWVFSIEVDDEDGLWLAECALASHRNVRMYGIC